MTPTRWRSKPPVPTPSETGSATNSRFATAPCRPRRGSATRSSLANLVAALLVELAPRLVAHLEPGGVLVAERDRHGSRRRGDRGARGGRAHRQGAARRRRVGRAPSRGTAMTLHRFFVEPAEMAGDRFPLPAGIERQVRAVLRLRDGDRLVLLPNDGTEAICRLDGDACAVEDRRPASGEPRHRLTVVQALLKGDGLEQVVQHATEVGVAAFQLAVTERSIVRELPPRRLERLRTIAREAAEQSERGIVPEILAPVPLARAMTSGSVLLFERHDGAAAGRRSRRRPRSSSVRKVDSRRPRCRPPSTPARRSPAWVRGSCGRRRWPPSPRR